MKVTTAILSSTIGILTATQFQRVCILLPALYGSLLSQFISWVIPPLTIIVTFILTKILPPIIFLPCLLSLSPVHIASLPLIDLIILFHVATLSTCSNRLSFLVFFSSFLLTSLIGPVFSFDFTQIYSYIPSWIHISCLITATVATNLYAKSQTLESIRRSPPKNKGKRPSQKKSPLSSIPYPIHLILVFLASLFVAHLVTKEGASLIKLIHPRQLPANFNLLTQERGLTGLISVVQSNEGYRILFADFSALGGLWIDPRYHPDSVFSQFYVHEAVRLTNLPENSSPIKHEKALFIGVGIGVVANALYQHNVKVDAVEIDPVVAKYAKLYFNLEAPVIVEDALQFLAKSPAKVYDYVVHDVFTGGSVPTALFSVETLERIREVMKDNGVLAVNFVGITNRTHSADGTRVTALIMDRLATIFDHVRLFSDGDESVTHNLVLFASNVPERVTFRQVTLEDCLGSQLRMQKLSTFEKMEVKREELGPPLDSKDSSDWIMYKGMWDIFMEFRQVLGQVYPPSIWPALLAAESRR